MKKSVKLAMYGLTAMMLLAGCSKNEAEVAETTAETTEAAAETNAETTAAVEEITDKGEVTKLGDYKGIELTKISTEVTDEELEAVLNNILAANPEYIEITDRAAQNGDITNIDYVGMKDGEAFDGGTAEGYDLELGSKTFIEGFEEGLVGAKTGDELSLNLTFPENYGNADLAGQAVVFDVTVNSIKEKKEAVLDDAFVQRMSDFTTVDEFRADTLADIEAQKELQAQQQLEADALQAAVNNSEYELNQAAVDQLYQQQMDYYNGMVQMYGVTMEDYVSMIGITEEQFQEEMKNAAEMTVKQQLLVEAIAEAEGLQVKDEDRERLAEQFGADVETLKQAYGEESLDETVQICNVVGFITENAVIK